MPYTRANPPTADNPSGAMNTVSAPDPDTGGNPNMGGDLAAAIALLAQTLAVQNVHPPPAPHAPTVPSLTRLREPNTFNGSDANKLRVFILQCSLHFQDCANAFSSGRAKVTYCPILSNWPSPRFVRTRTIWPCSTCMGQQLGHIPYGIGSKLRSFRPSQRSRSQD